MIFYNIVNALASLDLQVLKCYFSDTKLSICIYAVLFVLLYYNKKMLSNIFI